MKKHATIYTQGATVDLTVATLGPEFGELGQDCVAIAQRLPGFVAQHRRNRAVSLNHPLILPPPPCRV
jgi:hypothetical protein